MMPASYRLAVVDERVYGDTIDKAMYRLIEVVNFMIEEGLDGDSKAYELAMSYVSEFSEFVLHAESFEYILKEQQVKYLAAYIGRLLEERWEINGLAEVAALAPE